MRKKIKTLIIFISITVLVLVVSCCLLVSVFGKDKNTEWMQKWKRVINIDLKTDRNIRENFIIEFNHDWDFPREIDPYEGYFIYIDLDILYNEPMDNYIIIELLNNDEIIYSNKVNIFQPIKKNNSTVTRKENIINYKYMQGLFGIIDLDFDRPYQINIETFFDENLFEINNLKFSISKRVL